MRAAVRFIESTVASTFTVIRIMVFIFDSSAGTLFLFLFLYDLFLQRLQVQVSQRDDHIFHNQLGQIKVLCHKPTCLPQTHFS
jgi:hypothetical protein